MKISSPLSKTSAGLLSRLIQIGGLAALSLCASLRVHASTGMEGAAFLNIPVGAGPAALGGAYSALSGDAYAPVWNPAGLGVLNDTEFAGQHLSYLESINYEYVSFVHALNQNRESSVHRGLGVSAQYLGTGDIPRTELDINNQPVSNGNFSSHYGAYTVAYGQTVTDKLSLGLGGKWINAQLDGVSANAYALNLGSLYQANEKLSLAATVTDLGTKLKFLDEGDSLPLAFHAGAAYRPDSHWLLSGEGVYEKAGLASFHVGSQWRPMEALALRAGYRTDTLKGLNALAGFNAGVGVMMWGQEFAYAWSPYGDLGTTQYFSLLLHFGAREEAKRNLIKFQTIKQHQLVSGEKEDAATSDYQQLMQLLSSDEDHLASRPASISGDHQ